METNYMEEDVRRLVTEWMEHDKIVLAVDYDDTIFQWKHSTQKECDRVLELVKWCRVIGAYIMIHTCSFDDRHDEIREYCKSKGLEIDSINKNPIDLPFGTEGKPYYNWQLCDRSGLGYAYEVLTKAAKIVITEKRKTSSFEDEENNYILKDQVDWDTEDNKSHLKTIFKDGEMKSNVTLRVVRDRLKSEI